MSLSSIDYKCLEFERFDAENITMQYRFKPGENVSLMLGLSDERPEIHLYMPGGEMWPLERCTSEQEAREKYNLYLTQLKQGYHIHVTKDGIEIVEPR